MSNKCLGAVLACLLTLATFAGFAVWNSHAPMAQDDFYFTTMVPWRLSLTARDAR